MRDWKEGYGWERDGLTKSDLRDLIREEKISENGGEGECERCDGDGQLRDGRICPRCGGYGIIE